MKVCATKRSPQEVAYMSDPKGARVYTEARRRRVGGGEGAGHKEGYAGKVVLGTCFHTLAKNKLSFQSDQHSP